MNTPIKSSPKTLTPLSLLVLLVIAFSAPACAETEIGVTTATGWVNFMIEDNWSVLESQTKMPEATFVYRLPHPVIGKKKIKSPPFPKLTIKLFQRKEPPRGQKEAPHSPIDTYFAKQLGNKPPVITQIPKWYMATQTVTTDSVTYTVLDAKKNLADMDVFVRLTWPHLKNAPAKYDQAMNKLFRNFLASVIGGMGVYTPDEGEKARQENKTK